MNEDKFTGLSNIYAKYRPTYPDIFISYLYKELGFDTKSTIADIGSGTGILTKLLLKQGSMVYAIEPMGYLCMPNLIRSYVGKV